MIDWSLGYSSMYYMSVIDHNTMRDIDRIEITGGSIKRSLTDLRESASIDCVNYDSNSEQIIRIWLDAKQDGDSSHIPLFTGIASCPSSSYTGIHRTNTLECYSMLKLASDVLLPRGWYAPVDINCERVIKDLLSVVGVPVITDPNAPLPNLKQSIIAENNESRLSMVDKILSAIGEWRMRLDGYGSIYIEPLSRKEKSIYGSMDNDVIETQITVSYDWYSIPNVLRCVLDEMHAEARDEDADSPFSIQNRGREVWLEESDVQLSTDETLAEYAIRRLKELQQVGTTMSYTKRFDPEVYPSDCIRINYPAQNIEGLYVVTEQNITLGYGAKTSEEVTKL